MILTAVISRSLRAAFCAFFVLCASGVHAAVEVVVSIKPLHALVAGVMGDLGAPRLIVTGATSPHVYQMRPSEAVALHTADLIVWVGETLESFLVRPIANLGTNAEIVTLQRTTGIRLLRNRPGGVWSTDTSSIRAGELHADEPHADEPHADEPHADEPHADEPHADEPHADEPHADENDHGHAHHPGAFDAHLWLDPDNARRIVEVVAAALARIDPEHAPTYRRNAAAMSARIIALEASLRARLAPVRLYAYVVFHDAYQYFERAFGLDSIGAVTLGPTRLPGVSRLAALRRTLVTRDVRCMFVEPQFEPRLARTVVEGIGIRIATIDPLGADLAAGADAWFKIMHRLGDTIAGCLEGG